MLKFDAVVFHMIFLLTNLVALIKKRRFNATFFYKACLVVILITFTSSCTFGSMKNEIDPHIKNLLSRFSNAEIEGGGRLVFSYQGTNSIFLYDQALAVLAFVHSSQKVAAEDILTALSNLQSSNGTWAFEYESVNGKICPADEEISPSGAIAWVAIAIEAYQIKYGSRRLVKYDDMLNKTLNYLSSLQVSVKWKGTCFSPIVFSPTRADVISFEHNADAYAAFLNASYVNPQKANEYAKIASNLHAFLEALWEKNRFYVGFNVAEEAPNRDEFYLDTQTLGFLALGPVGKGGEDYTKGLVTNFKEFQTSHPVCGFVACHSPGSSPSPVWSEGSLAMMLAMKIAHMENCEGITLNDLELAMDSITQKDYGVLYATPSSDPDFSSSSSVAGTAWKYFFLKGFNPYHPHPLISNSSEF